MNAKTDTIPSTDTPRSMTQVLLDLKAELTQERLCIDDLLEALHERGFGFLLFIFALPAALPIPALGINTIIALPLFFLTAQQAMGRHTLWLPKKLRTKTFSRSLLDGVIDKGIPFIEKVQWLIKPRLGFMTQGVFSNVIGIVGLIMAFSITIPLPLTNTVPAMGIALMALGVIMRDGLAVLAGAIGGLIWVAMLLGVTIFIGIEGIDLVKDTIKSWLS